MTFCLCTHTPAPNDAALLASLRSATRIKKEILITPELLKNLTSGGTPVLSRMISERIRVTGSSAYSTKMFLWRKALAATAPATWGPVLDSFVATHGWPSAKEDERNNMPEGNYGSLKDTLAGLSGWMRQSSEPEVLWAIGNMPIIASTLLQHTTALTPVVLNALRLHPNLLLAMARKNPNLTSSQAEVLWAFVCDSAPVPVDRVATGTRNATRNGLRPVGPTTDVAMEALADILITRSFLPSAEVQDRLWSLATEPTPAHQTISSGLWTSFSLEPLPARARTTLLNPALALPVRELGAIWLASPTWQVATLLAQHPNITPDLASKMCKVISTSQWRADNLRTTTAGADFIPALLANPVADVSANSPLWNLLLKKATPREFPMIIRRSAEVDHAAIVTAWLARYAEGALSWLASPAAGRILSPLPASVLAPVMGHGSAQRRALAIAAIRSLHTYRSASHVAGGQSGPSL